ncbi:MAG: hypothetical protein RIC14_05740 [Filomicrobium sp.]
MKMLMIFAAVLAAAQPSGCGLGGLPPPQKVIVKGDTYCRIAKPISWSKNDTKPTVQQITKHNAKHARVCGKRKPKKAATS